jgi:hypothetical protein
MTTRFWTTVFAALTIRLPAMAATATQAVPVPGETIAVVLLVIGVGIGLIILAVLSPKKASSKQMPFDPEPVVGTETGSLEPVTNAEMDAWRAALEREEKPPEERRPIHNPLVGKASEDDWSLTAAVLFGIFAAWLTGGFALITMATFGVLTAFIAKKRGQPPIKWWILGTLFAIFALIYQLFFMEDKTKKQCNFCREFVDKEAVVCPRCGHDPYGSIETAPRP